MAEDHHARQRDAKLTKRAQQLRREPTEPEIKLWRYLSRSQLGGLKFRRQTALEPYIADFFCPAIGLVVEVDGHTHETARDGRRDAYLSAHGLNTFRLSNRDVMDNIEGALNALLTFRAVVAATAQLAPAKGWRPPTPTLP